MDKEAMRPESLGPENTLTPTELINAALKTNIFGGYSKTQVDTILEQAAELIEALQLENRSYKQRQEELEQEVNKYQDMETSLRSALVSSQRMSENIVSSAQLQAESILEEARLAKARAEFNMEKLPDALRAEIQRLMDARERLRDDLTAFLRAHESLVERIPRAEDRAEEFVRKALSRPEDSERDGDDVEDHLSPQIYKPAPEVPEPSAEPQHIEEDQGYVNL